MAKLGEVLQQAREAKNLSINDVSDAIHLSTKQVSALEEHAFSSLPEPMITRGFIRTYANYLELDHEPLLESYRELVPNQEIGSLVVNANVNEVMSVNRQQPWLMYILGSILTLLFVVVWFYYMDNVPTDGVANEASPDTVVLEQTTESALSTNGESNEVVASVPVVAPEVSSTIETSDAAKMQTTEIANVEKVADDVAALAAELSAESDVTQAQTQTQATNSDFIDTVNLLYMTFPEESWLNVRDQYGKSVFKQLMPPGSEKAITIQKPFSLTIGNAINVRVKYEGLEVDLVPSTAHNVARLEVE